MHVDVEDRPNITNRPRKTPWIPFALLGVFSAACLTLFSYLHQIGWGITVDTNKLKDAFTINGAPAAQTTNSPQPLASIPPAEIQPITAPQQTATSRSDAYTQPRGMLPVDWSIHLKKFNSVFIQHAACDPYNMKWTQMECSNFRARAMKRFGEEWNKNSYWNGSEIINNKSADARVNSELEL